MLKSLPVMGQRASCEEITTLMEDLIWNEFFDINESAVYAKMDGKYVTGDIMSKVIENLMKTERDHYNKSLFFLERNCLKMSDFHNKMNVRYCKMKNCLTTLFVEVK